LVSNLMSFMSVPPAESATVTMRVRSVYHVGGTFSTEK
jgi:hypothetical protein